METLNQYFSYNKDCDVSSVFYQLYKQMKVIHDNGMFVPMVDGNNISVDNGFSFNDKSLSNNIDLDRRENLVDLTKLFLGTYISLPTGFMDFSHVDTEWFSQNMGSIASMITDESFPEQFFSSVFLEGQNSYYSDYADRVKQNEDLSSRSNIRGYGKVLKNAASKFYQDPLEEEFVDIADGINKKTAFINMMFYPTLIISLFLVCFVVYNCFKFLGT